MCLSEPKVSVIIPIFNTLSYIEDCLNSVINQTYKNIEIICVDDCSPYKECDIVKKYIEKDSRIKYIRNSKNLGIAATRNAGIELASGEYILPLDSDDVIAKDYCKKAIQVFKENKDISVVYSNAQMFKENKFWNWPLQDFNAKTMPFVNHVFCSAFFKKKDWEKYKGYSEEMKHGFEDWDFWLSFVEDGKKFYKIPQVLFYYRQVENGRSANMGRNKKNKRNMRELMVKRHKSLYKISNYFTYKEIRKIGLFKLIKILKSKKA